MRRTTQTMPNQCIYRILNIADKKYKGAPQYILIFCPRELIAAHQNDYASLQVSYTSVHFA